MSINVNVKTPNKKELAEFMRACAKMVEVSANEYVTLSGHITFDKKDKET